MANNYTQFSVLLPKVDEAELAKFMTEVDARNDEAEERGSMPLRGMSYETRDGELWLYAEEEGDVQAAGELIREFPNRFEVEGGVYMSWAMTCSEPRVNQFEGGAMVVTRKDTLWVAAYDVLKLAAEAGITVLNEWE